MRKLTDDLKAKIRADFEDFSEGEFPDHQEPCVDPIFYVFSSIDPNLCAPEDKELRNEILIWLIDVEINDEWDVDPCVQTHINDASNREMIY